MQKLSILLFSTMCVTLAGCAGLPLAETNDKYAVVDAYVEAYNARDIAAMAALMDKDIQWLSVESDRIETMANGRDDLVQQMTDYVSSSSATTSKLSKTVTDGSFLAVQEIAQWQDENGATKEQSALAIYEIRSGLVRRVWYYPSAK